MFDLPLRDDESTTILVITSAQNNELAIPAINVTAKPLIGPTPKL